MYLKWSKECYLCECPLEPCIHTNTTEERILIRKYRKIRPIFTVNNDMYLKFFGTEVKRVCYAYYKASRFVCWSSFTCWRTILGIRKRSLRKEKCCLLTSTFKNIR